MLSQAFVLKGNIVFLCSGGKKTVEILMNKYDWLG